MRKTRVKALRRQLARVTGIPKTPEAVHRFKIAMRIVKRAYSNNHVKANST